MPFDNSNYHPIPEGHRRLLVLAEFLETKVPVEKFSLSRWQCGTTACAVGWAATIPEFKALGLSLGQTNCPVGPIFEGKMDMDAARAFFHLDIAGCDALKGDAVHLFHACGYGPDPRAATDVAARIRSFVAEQAKVLA